jgi:hypothetical protein
MSDDVVVGDGDSFTIHIEFHNHEEWDKKKNRMTLVNHARTIYDENWNIIGQIEKKKKENRGRDVT